MFQYMEELQHLNFSAHMEKRRIFYLLQQKDTNSVFFSGMLTHLSLLQGFTVKISNSIYCVGCTNRVYWF
uniref:Uncharacterized protein n=1 Tax=Rhizophora mucronata TaxID=61149 RepID=A0A2P2KL49_RHIMU